MTDLSKPTLHLDFCEIKWSAGELALLERIPVDDPRVAGTYTYISPPHADDACPFNGAERVRLDHFDLDGRGVARHDPQISTPVAATPELTDSRGPSSGKGAVENRESAPSVQGSSWDAGYEAGWDAAARRFRSAK